MPVLTFRLEECEEQLRHYEHVSEVVRSESKEKLKNEVVSKLSIMLFTLS